MKSYDNIAIFFIVGRPRSGTTLIRTLFDAHPNVCITPECQFIINLFPRYGNIKVWKEKDLIDFQDDLKKQLLFDTWNIDDESLKNTLSGCVGENTYSNICKTVMMQFRSIYPKKDILLFGDKNPGYTIYTEKLLKIFPEAKFIHIIRDYRDNFVSLKNVDFEIPVTSLVVEKWRLFYKKFHRAMQKNPGSHYELIYEEFVKEPEKYMKELLDFTGVDFIPEIFDFYKKKDTLGDDKLSNLVKKYHSSLMKKVNTSRIGLWKKEMSKLQVGIADHTAGRYADILGYEREYKKCNPFIILLALPGITFAQILSCATKIIDHFPYRLRMNILNRWPLALALFVMRIFRPGKYREVKEKLK